VGAKTAAVLVIGEEILSGKTADQNAALLIKELRALGVALRRIVVLGDVREAMRVGVSSIGVVWGFHNEETLRQGTDRIAHSPSELSETIQNFFAQSFSQKSKDPRHAYARGLRT
jgi:phosphoglycolate phosphatase-like HAD superfamily hydrolase